MHKEERAHSEPGRTNGGSHGTERKPDGLLGGEDTA